MTKKRKAMFIFGTRPEAIKVAPVIKELKRYNNRIKTIVVVSAQHREMLKDALDSFDIRPDFDLRIMEENQTVYDITINLLRRMRQVLQEAKPDLVVIQGDTTTAFVTALSAFYEKIPVAHVEAGLRTRNKYAPFPEEINRVLISHISDLHFAPTENGKQNLLKEGIPEKNIFITGNTVIDALLFTSKKIKNMQPKFLKDIISNKNKLILVTGHRRESFGQPLRNICLALRTIAERNPNIEIIYPVHLNPNVRKPVFNLLKGHRNIYLVDPLDYPTFVWLMNQSYLILTDSGGIQEEAPSLGKPVLVMREITERSEGIKVGTAKLVGTDIDKIVYETEKLLKEPAAYLKMSNTVNSYGDGKAAKQIVDIIKKFLNY